MKNNKINASGIIVIKKGENSIDKTLYNWNVSDISIGRLVNKIIDTYFNYIKENSKVIDAYYNKMNTYKIYMEFNTFFIGDNEYDVDSEATISFGIKTSLGIKGLDQCFKTKQEKIKISQIPNKILEILEFYAYECDTDESAINVYLSKLKIEG